MNIPAEYLAVVLALAGHTVAVVWWGAKLDARVRHLEMELRELKEWRLTQGQQLDARMAVVESQLNRLIDMLKEKK